MSGSGKSGDRDRSRRNQFKHRGRQNNQSQTQESFKSGNKGKPEKNKASLFERPKWTPPVQPAISLQTFSCALCGKPIKDIAMAINEPEANKPVHFDCVINKIAEKEKLEKGDVVNYIGGGRFGIVHFKNPNNTKGFIIKKIFEWENKENRTEWRDEICFHFSVT